MWSIVHEMDDVPTWVCFKCRRNRHAGLEKHHIFGAANRRLSEEDGLWVMLCSDCHRTGKDAAHRSKETRHWLHYKGRLAYCLTHTEAEFMERYGRYYD